MIEETKKPKTEEKSDQKTDQKTGQESPQNEKQKIELKSESNKSKSHSKSKSNKTIVPKVIALLTSGGDSQGMNAVIRSVVRIGLHKKFKVFLIYEGYNGLIKGEDYIKEATLSSVDHIIHVGGTFIGSSRCDEFREPGGRVIAGLSLIKRNISNLIVIGGDGSLTGANLLKNEWNSILNTLLQTGKISDEEKNRNNYLNIIGIVASIDNDFCRTDMTIGADSALHRIVESVDAISTTATSHRRAMIIQVMGRNCGYLALVTAMATEATFTFLPERPPSANWSDTLCEKIEYEFRNGRRLNIIIVSEGALDLNGNPITSDDVKKVITEKTKREVRVTILGHIQRGGLSSAFDRILGSRMGWSAVDSLEKSDTNTESTVLTINGNQIVGKPLMQCVEETHELWTATKDKDWKKCFELRGISFVRNFELFVKIHQKEKESQKSIGKCFAVMQVGEPSPGMNAAVLSFVRMLILNDKTVCGIKDGFEGLIEGKMFEMKWVDVNCWTCQSGALLGTSKVPNKISKKQFELMAQQISENKIKGMLVIGGFKAFRLVQQTVKNRKKFSEFQIPFCVIPATIENNVPGSELSVGVDSTLNKITHICTEILMATRGTRGRLYIIEMQTSYCGYLTVMSAIASEADYCYIFEKEFTKEDVNRDANCIKEKMTVDNRNRLIIVNRFANENLNGESISEIYSKVGKDVFNVVSVDVSNLLKSVSPSPFDRILAIKMGVKSADWFRTHSNLDESFNAVVLGITEQKYSFSIIEELTHNTDFEHQIPKTQWFVELADLINLCS